MENKEPTLRIMPMVKDTNRFGTVFGGFILGQIDIAGSLEARRLAPLNFVTVAINKVEFCNPVFVGDVVSFYTKTIKIGTSSITVKVDVFADRMDKVHNAVPVTSAEMVFVAVGEDKKPIPILRNS
jgi:acyl-CoA thioesterase YciA